MARIPTETGPRFVQEDHYKGRKIIVVTGYHAFSDKWPIHIYIEEPGKGTTKVADQFLADSEREAFDEGFRIATKEIDGS